MNLDELRKKIDKLDEKLVLLLNERTGIASEIGQIKGELDAEVYVPAREKKVLERVAGINNGPLPNTALESIYREIMSASLALERNVRIAYLGPPATFTHMAARSRFGSSVNYHETETISDVFLAVEKGQAEYGVVPIENSTEGAVTHTLDQCCNTALKICAEIYLPISHNLLSKEDKADIERVYSNPQVFGQCRNWLHANLHGVDLIPISSTARAAERAASESKSAALAGPLAAELYGLNVLASDIQDLSGNTTRFLVMGRSFGAPTGNDKTSVFFAVKDKVGTLYDALDSFRKYDVNMTKIESRPSKTKAWEYLFFVDIEGHANEEKIRSALDELANHCTLMTILGAYPNAMVGQE